MKSLWDEIANDILDKVYGNMTEQLEYDTDRIIEAIKKRIDKLNAYDTQRYKAAVTNHQDVMGYLCGFDTAVEIMKEQLK